MGVYSFQPLEGIALTTQQSNESSCHGFKCDVRHGEGLFNYSHGHWCISVKNQLFFVYSQHALKSVCTLNSLSPTSGVREHTATTQKYWTGSIGMAAPEQGLHRILTSKFFPNQDDFFRTSYCSVTQFTMNVFFSYHPSFGLPFLSETSSFVLKFPNFSRQWLKKIHFPKAFQVWWKAPQFFQTFHFFEDCTNPVILCLLLQEELGPVQGWKNCKVPGTNTQAPTASNGFKDNILTSKLHPVTFYISLHT